LLNHSRTPPQCRVRYSRLLLSQIVTFHPPPAHWSQEQDEMLKGAVEKAKQVNNGALNWRLVAEYMDRTKTSVQCSRRWRKIMNETPPDSTPWTPEEVSPCLPCLATDDSFRMSSSRKPMELSCLTQEEMFTGKPSQRRLEPEFPQSVAEDGRSSPVPTELIGFQMRSGPLFHT
jgi:hypothetical protein